MSSTRKRKIDSVRGLFLVLVLALTWQTNLVSDIALAQGPYSIWDDSATPAIASVTDTWPVELGVKFRSDVDGYITGIRFYKGSLNTGTHIGNLWTSAGTLLATTTFINETASGWQEVNFPAPHPITAGTTYVASYHTDVGRYAADTYYFLTSGVDNPPLHALKSGVEGGNGVYKYGPSGFPTTGSPTAANYWVDVVFATEVTPDTEPPTVSLTSPTEGSEVTGPVTVSADASDNVGVAGVQFLLDGVALGAEDTVPPYTVEWDSTSATGGPHVLTAVARDGTGNTASSEVWVIVVPLGAHCPCSIWDDAAVPAIPSVTDPRATQVGVKFQAYVDGYITGIRFYKGVLNTGTHIGNLWDSAGQLLGSATFVSETDSGWQQVNFAAPVAVAADTTYVASYHTEVGRYAADGNYFTSGVDNPPLRALANGVDGGNGVYVYGDSSAFPTNSYNAANYWVDVVFVADLPDAVPGGPYTADEGSEVCFDGSGSSHPYGKPLSFNWYLGDGNTGTGPTPCHTYQDPGTYNVCLTVSDPDGVTDTKCTTAAINDVAPAINVEKLADKKYVLTTGEEVVYTVSVWNNSVTTDPVDITSIVDDTYGDVLNPDNPNILETDCTTAEILPGETYACNFKVFLQTDALGDHTNTVTVTAADDEDTAATGTGDATVTVLPPSAATDPALCYFDREPDLSGQQFRLPFTPDMQQWPDYKLLTSNPGQFFYNVFYTGQGLADFTIVFPEPFVTSGDVPVRVYTEVSVASVNGFNCFVPDPASEIYAGDMLVLSAVDVPGLVYVTVHLDYGLKGTTGYAQSLNGDALDAETGEVLIPNLSNYTFEVSGSQNDSQTIQNVNTFKRIPGIGGLVLDSLGGPVLGVQVEFYDPAGQLIAAETTDEDGWYMFEYKHTGKEAEYTIRLPEYGLSQAVLLKANKFAEVNFTVE